MLALKNRVPSSITFRKCKIIRTKHFILKIKPNDLDYPRFAVVVSKKIAKKAVERNSVKRLVRDCLQKNLLHKASGYDMLYVIKKEITDSKEQICEEVIKTARINI